MGSAGFIIMFQPFHPPYAQELYTAQVNIWQRYRDKHLTCFPEATWRRHHHLGRMAATRFASHVPVQQSDLLTDAPTLQVPFASV